MNKFLVTATVSYNSQDHGIHSQVVTERELLGYIAGLTYADQRLIHLSVTVAPKGE